MSDPVQGLTADGKSDFVITMRRTFQETMRDSLIDSVEELTGRKVIAFMSDNHIDPDIATETFVLEPSPDGDEGSSRDSATA